MRRRTLLALSAAFVAGALVGYSLHPRQPPVHSPYAVPARLCAKGVCVRVVHPPAERLVPEFYLTTTAKTWDELVSLPWSPAAADRWRGTVFCRQAPPECELLDRDRAHLLRVGDLAFYGDPDLLRQIAETLR
jgi:hypothetical protein